MKDSNKHNYPCYIKNLDYLKKKKKKESFSCKLDFKLLYSLGAF